jgi:hypothetical protein
MWAWLGYWFVIAERGRVFLYDHLGATPFDAVTSSRYWMAGLVASGYLCLAATLVAVIGWVRGRQWLPDPARVATLAVGPVVFGALIITGLLGSPRLPVGLASGVALTTLVGIYLAWWAATTVQRLGRTSLWLMLDGMGLVPLLTLTQALELPGRGLSVSDMLARSIVGACLILAVVWQGATAWLYRRRGARPGPVADVLRAALVLAYVALPTLHHLVATPPGYKYITTSTNFMPSNPWLLVATWTAAVVIVLGSRRLYARNSARRV